MPIDMEKFRSLPKVDPEARKGGKKCDWDGVRADMVGKGGFSVAEVWELTIDHALVDLEKDDDGNTIPPVTRFRTTRWLKGQADKDKMDVRQNEDGSYAYMVIGEPIKPA